MTKIFSGKLEVVEEHPNRVITTANGFLPMPSVVRFIEGVFMNSASRPAKAKKPDRKNIFLRDNGRCQYCEKKLSYDVSTVDHVIPKSKGGKDTWENKVLCCSPCNSKKADRFLHEVGMYLKTKPVLPSYFLDKNPDNIIVSKNRRHRD
jgi:hypothetical protein